MDGNRVAYPPVYVSKQKRRIRSSGAGLFPTRRLQYRPSLQLHICQLTTEDCAQIVQAWKNYVVTAGWPLRCVSRDVVTTPHRCHQDTCDLRQFSADVFICLASGNFHICTPELCYRTVTQDDGEACPLTARLHPSNLDYVAEHLPTFEEADTTGAVTDYTKFSANHTQKSDEPCGGTGDDAVSKSFRVLKMLEMGIPDTCINTDPPIKHDPPTPRPVATPCRKRKRVGQNAVKDPKPEPTPKRRKQTKVYRVCTYADLDDDTKYRERMAIYDEVVRLVLRDPKRDYDRVFDTLSTLFEAVWSLIVRSADYAYCSMKYHLSHHCFAVMNRAKGNGLAMSQESQKSEKYCVVPVLPWLADLVKPRTKIKNYKPAPITHTDRLLMSLIRRCEPADLMLCHRKGLALAKHVVDPL